MKQNMDNVYCCLENARTELNSALSKLSNFIKVNDTVFHGIHFEDFDNRINNKKEIVKNYIIPSIPGDS